VEITQSQAAVGEANSGSRAASRGSVSALSEIAFRMPEAVCWMRARLAMRSQQLRIYLNKKATSFVISQLLIQKNRAGNARVYVIVSPPIDLWIKEHLALTPYLLIVDGAMP
jgi:hypothetical protein